MNVLKKDLFSKPGARAKPNLSSYANKITTVNAASFPRSALQFLPQQFSDDCSPINSLRPQSSSNISQSLLPQQRVLGKDGLSQKPARLERREDIFGNLALASHNAADDSGLTSDILRVLSDTSSLHNVQQLSYRPPATENEVSAEDEEEIAVHPRARLGYSGSGGSPISSIRAATTSSEKKTPQNQIGKSPKTPRTTSSTAGGPSDSDISNCIIAVTEGRGLARGEVGIAAMDPRRPHLILCQISDSQRYTLSLAKMNVFNFVEAIVPNTFADGATPLKLYVDMMDRFPAVPVSRVQRRHFSEAAGLQMIQQYCSRQSESVMLLLKDKFYALAAAAALLKYIEFTQSVLFAPYSLKVEFQGTEGTTIIDLDTANRLELVMGLASRDEQQSLFGVLKHCRTKGGLRLLRANLLQPPADSARINARLDCVSELINNPILFNGIEVVISQMKNAEDLLSLCLHPPQQTGLRAAQHQLKYALLLKSILELVPALSSALAHAYSDFFTTARENLGDVRLSLVLKRVHLTIDKDAAGMRSGTCNQLNGCYMICSGINGLLDIAKKTYCELVQEISDLIDALKERLKLPLRLGFTQSRGYHIVISPADVPEGGLPEELILSHKSRTTVTCYTTELVALDQRCQQALHEIELMANVLLFELLNDIRGDISCLFPLCESLAELDVCIAFAHVGATSGYVRPTFGEELRVMGARHPVLDVTARERIVANDVFASKEMNFIILTGPNQSGKSIYIRQIALLQVMAQVGSFVPAVEAQFRIADRIFSRIGFDDSIEDNASTLMVELQDMEFIQNNLTKNSLVIVDELCRGTSVDEGTCLAFVLCEQLIDSFAFIFFTTHFLFLTKLEEMYFTVRNYHFETTLSDDAKPTLQYSHKILEGVTPAEQYGIRLAELMGYMPRVLDTARRCAQTLLRQRKQQPEVHGLSARYQLSQRLRVNLPQSDEATWEQILPVIRQYKKQYESLGPEEKPLQTLLNDWVENPDRSLVDENSHSLSNRNELSDMLTDHSPDNDDPSLDRRQDSVMSATPPSSTRYSPLSVSSRKSSSPTILSPIKQHKPSSASIAAESYCYSETRLSMEGDERPSPNKGQEVNYEMNQDDRAHLCGSKLENQNQSVNIVTHTSSNEHKEKIRNEEAPDMLGNEQSQEKQCNSAATHSGPTDLEAVPVKSQSINDEPDLQESQFSKSESLTAINILGSKETNCEVNNAINIQPSNPVNCELAGTSSAPLSEPKISPQATTAQCDAVTAANILHAELSNDAYSDQTREAALLLLSLQDSRPTETFANCATLHHLHLKSKKRKKKFSLTVDNAKQSVSKRNRSNNAKVERKKEEEKKSINEDEGKAKPDKNGSASKKRKDEKPSISELVCGLGASLPPVADKSPYYQWKFTQNKKAFQPVATACRGSPALAGGVASSSQSILVETSAEMIRSQPSQTNSE